jgi:hypothetical protein
MKGCLTVAKNTKELIVAVLMQRCRTQEAETTNEAEQLEWEAVCSPVRLLNFRVTCLRVGIWPKPAGIVPTKLLLVTSRSVRYIRVPRLSGRGPVSSLEAKDKTSKGLLGEKTSGIMPVRLFLPAQPRPTLPLSTA